LGRDTPSDLSDDVVAQSLQAFDGYVAACAERAVIAQQARRRPDLEAALTQRHELESTHARAVADRERRGGALREFASSLGLSADSAGAASDGLRRWVAAQEAKREESVKRRDRRT